MKSYMLHSSHLGQQTFIVLMLFRIFHIMSDGWNMEEGKTSASGVLK